MLGWGWEDLKRGGRDVEPGREEKRVSRLLLELTLCHAGTGSRTLATSQEIIIYEVSFDLR